MAEGSGSILDAIRAGDRVRIVNRFGQEHEGRAVMRGPGGWVLNMGGRHGTPAIATADNITKVRRPRGNPAPPAGKGPLWELFAHPAVVLGPRGRSLALSRFKRDGLAVWLRMDGSAVLFRRGPGGRRVQRTWRAVSSANAREILAELASSNPVQYEGDDRPTPRKRPKPRKPRPPKPPRENPRRALLGRRLYALEYQHAEDGERYRHDFGRGVEMFAQSDGTVLLRHREHPRKRVWADFPDQGRR